MNDLSYILNELGETHEDYFNAVAPPIIQTSNFCYKTVAEMKSAIGQEFERGFYTRGVNPTVAILRKKLAALEGADDALVFASGSGAIASAVLSVVKTGDHVVCVKHPYSWTEYLLGTYLKKFNIETSFIDGTSIEHFEKAIRPETSLIFLESPNSITFELQDLEAVAKLAKEKNITTIIDNSYSTPLNQTPLKYGIDISVHSASKYINGHADVVAGVVCSSKQRIEKMLRIEYMTFGAICQPFEAWLMLRGLRTLSLRNQQSNASAAKIIEYLESHPQIEKIYYPFSSSNPQLALAKKQMKSCGGLFSLELKNKDLKVTEKFCNALKRFRMACSWGGYESLQFPMCVFAGENKERKPGISPHIVRFYIGIEDTGVLLEDFKQALEKI